MGTPHRTIKTPVFKFDQLSPEAQAKAIEKNYDRDVDHEWWDAVYEDAVMMANIIGIQIDTRNGSQQPCIFFSGFSSQGDGACLEGQYAYKKGCLAELKVSAPAGYKSPETGQWVEQEGNAELHRICKALNAVQRKQFYGLEATVKQQGHYNHSGCTSIEVTHAEDMYRDIGEAEDDIKTLLRDFMDWIYSRLEAEYNYLTSEEHIREAIQDDEFTEDGTPL